MLNLTGATVEVVEPENGVIKENQKKLTPRMMRAKTAGQIQGGTTIITHPRSTSGNNKKNPALTHTGAMPEAGELGNGSNFTDADQNGSLTKKCKVRPQPKDMEVVNQTTQTINQPISENNQINSAINLKENKSMGRAEEPVNLDKMFEEQDSIEIVNNPFILNKEEGRAAAVIYFE
eukprot:6769291-Ditylum_brightwellii.AAC.1